MRAVARARVRGGCGRPRSVMTEPNLLIICAAAFLAVLLLLSLLAGLIRVLTAVFPAESAESDAPVIAAIHTAVARVYPGTRVTNIEEVR